MHFHIQANDEDYINFNIYHMFHSKQGKKNILMGRLLCFLFSAIVLIMLILVGVRQSLIIRETVLLCIISVIWFIHYPARAKKTIRKQIASLKKEGELPYSQEETIDFGETEIVETSANGVNKVAYSEIDTIYETEDYLYLKRGALNYIILPSRCLEGKEKELMEFLKEKTEQK